MDRATKNAATKRKLPAFEYDVGAPIILPEIRVIQVFGDITAELAAPVVASIHYINATAGTDSRPIKVFVNSDGGSFDDGFAIADTIRTSEIPVETYCLGRAYSIALPIFMSGKTRYAYQNSSIMFHGMSLDAGGSARNLRVTVDGADKANAMMMEFIAGRSKIPLAMLKSAVEKNKDLYLYTDDMIKYKMAHKVI